MATYYLAQFCGFSGPINGNVLAVPNRMWLVNESGAYMHKKCCHLSRPYQEIRGYYMCADTSTVYIGLSMELGHHAYVDPMDKSQVHG